MYRVVNFMAFGDSAVKVHQACKPGGIVAVMNPKFMPPKPGSEQNLVTYVIDSEKSLI